MRLGRREGLLRQGPRAAAGPRRSGASAAARRRERAGARRMRRRRYVDSSTVPPAGSSTGEAAPGTPPGADLGRAPRRAASFRRPAARDEPGAGRGR